jgi:hypothetical protein
MTIQQITDALQKNAPDGFYIKYVGALEGSNKQVKKDDVIFLPPFYEYKFGKEGKNLMLGVAVNDKKIYVEESPKTAKPFKTDSSTTKPNKSFFNKIKKIWDEKYNTFAQIKIDEMLAAAPAGFSINIKKRSDNDSIEWGKDPDGVPYDLNNPCGVADLVQNSTGKKAEFAYEWQQGEKSLHILFIYGKNYRGLGMPLKKGLKTLSEIMDNSLTSTKAPSAGGGGGGASTYAQFTAAEQAEIQDALYNTFGLDGKVQAIFKMGSRAQAVRIYPYAGSLKGRKAFKNRFEFGDEFTKRKFRDYTQYGGSSNFSDGLKSFLSRLEDGFKKLPTDAEYLANPEILKRDTANKEFLVKKTLGEVRKEKRESNKKSVARGRGKERADIDSQIESVEFVEPPQESGGRMERRKTIKAGQADKRTGVKNILAKGRAKRGEIDLNAPETAQAWESMEKMPKQRKARAAGLVRGAYKESVKRIMQKIRTREKAVTILKNEIKALQ